METKMITNSQFDKFMSIVKCNNGIRLPSIKHISYATNINKYSVYKLIKELISTGVIEKFGNRFFVISNYHDNSPESIQQRLINKAKINLNILKLLQRNFIYDKQTISFINQNGMYFDIYFPIKAKKISLSIVDIDNYPNIEITNIIKRCKIK